MKPLQDDILKQSKHQNIYLPICFTKTTYTYSNLQHRCVFRSVSRCLQHIFNSITFVSALSFDALFWCVQLCTQHLKGIRWLSQLAGTTFFKVIMVYELLGEHVPRFSNSINIVMSALHCTIRNTVTDVLCICRMKVIHCSTA